MGVNSKERLLLFLNLLLWLLFFAYLYSVFNQPPFFVCLTQNPSTVLCLDLVLGAQCAHSHENFFLEFAFNGLVRQNRNLLAGALVFDLDVLAREGFLDAAPLADVIFPTNDGFLDEAALLNFGAGEDSGILDLAALADLDVRSNNDIGTNL